MSKVFTAVAAIITAASVFYLRTLIHTSSKIMTQILGIPIYNAESYMSKLRGSIFLFNVVGCLIECIFYYSIHYKLKYSYISAINDIINLIKRHSSSIQISHNEDTTSIDDADKHFANTEVENIIEKIKTNSDFFKLETPIMHEITDAWVNYETEKKNHKPLANLMKTTIIEYSPHISKAIVNKIKDIKDGIEGQVENLLKEQPEAHVRTIIEALIPAHRQIQKKITETTGRGNDKAFQIILKSDEIISRVLNLENIKPVINKSTLPCSLIKGVLCIALRDMAKEIEKNSWSSPELVKFLSEIPRERGKMFSMFIQNIICNIIIELANELQPCPDPPSIIHKILSGIGEKMKKTEELDKIRVMLKEKERTLTIRMMADKFAKKIMTTKELESEMKELLSNNLGYTWTSETIKTIENTISAIIKNNAKWIACRIRSDGKNAAEAISAVLMKEINERTIETNADEMVEKLSKVGAVKIRKTMSMLSLTSLFVIKVTLLIFLHRSKSLGYHLYLIMNVESLILGIFQMSLFTLAAENASHVRLSIGFITFIVLMIEAGLDKVFYAKPAQTVNVQVWVACISNLVAIPLWACSIYGDEVGINEKKDISKVDDSHHVGKLWSPYLMLPFSTVFRDFLVPLILPLALISYRPSWITRYAFPVVLFAGNLVVTIMDDNNELELTLWGINDCLWILLGPQIVAFVLSLLAIHTKSFLTRYIQNNTGYVLFMCFAVQFCYSAMATFSYVGVAKFVAGTNKYFSGYIEGHTIICEILMFIFSSLSRGYDVMRKEYGLGMNVPLEDSMDPPGPLGWIAQVIDETLRITNKDFTTSISDYL